MGRVFGKIKQIQCNLYLARRREYCLDFFHLQVAVDIFKGITDEDARYLAEKLEFQGPLLEEVGYLDRNSCTCKN